MAFSDGLWTNAAEVSAKINFNQQIRPILAENCFKCHGADEKQRKGKLRLDLRDEAVAKKAIVPGKPEESELIKRLTNADEDDVMPPPKEHLKVSDTEQALLRQWIADGAEYLKHWAFIPPVKSAVPPVRNPKSPIPNEIDSFVLAKLDELKLNPAAPAPKEQWLRRVSFSLTGLPPSIEELDAFAADTTTQAREHVVDRLLKSAAYGEHMAKDWMDVARYADSYGRHEDGDMLVWPWRDWVIKAFNDNLPYDQFITWQTAGDLLPDPTQDQLVATAFNRLALQSNESGNDPEEFRLDQVSDRVRANGLAFMGLSVECAKCHDHKYDPISQREYWQMAAFFDNIDENGVYSQFCPLAIPSPSKLFLKPEEKDKLAIVEKQIADKENEMQKIRDSAKAKFDSWIAGQGMPGKLQGGAWNSFKSWFGMGATNEWDPHAAVHLDFEERSVVNKELVNKVDKKKSAKLRAKLTSIKGPNGNGNAMLMNGDDELTLPKLGEYREFDSFSFAVWLKPQEHRDRAVVICDSRGGNDDGRGYEVLLENEVPSFALMHFQPGNEIRLRAKKPLTLNEWTHLAVSYDGSSRASGLKIYINGVIADAEIVHDHLIKDIARREEWGDIDFEQVRFTFGGREHDSPLKNCGVDEYWVFDRAISPGEVKQLAGISTTSDDWFGWWLSNKHKPWMTAEKEMESIRKRRTGVLNGVLEMMVMQELPKRRPSYIRVRGDSHQRGDQVEPDVPANVMPFPKGLPRNRLGFAQWLVSREHPLTSRIVVNRVWQMFFGRGLVGTPQDFGTRGEMPSHPELFDWLAVDFMEHGWDVKRLCRMIALSETFGQKALPENAQTLAIDPENRWLAHGPSIRLSAEELRDQALACSGHMITLIGGPSVRPYMPQGLYRESGLQQKYRQDTGDGLYRRSMYSFWRRTLPPPELAAFDAPSREFCVMKREKTSTPIQALVLLNGPQFLEAQRLLAGKILRLFPNDDSSRCATAFRILTSRKPDENETAVLCRMLQNHREYFKAHPQEAHDVMLNGDHGPDLELPFDEVAATAMVVRTLMSHVDSLNR